jgi:SOS-response transcriptional repressor LexA
LEGRLYLVNYEDSREQFKVIRVLEMDESGIIKEKIKLWNFDEFKVWFQALNNLEIRKEQTHHSKDGKIIREIIEEQKFISYLPLYSIKAACGYFGDGESVDELGWIKAEGIGHLNSDMFVVRAVGHSMEPKIQDGDYCVFQANPAGTRQGKIVLAQHRGYFDEENAGAYSIKEYHSQKKFYEDGIWQHEEIVLKPLNKEYNPIVLTPDDIDDFRIVGEFLGVLRM